MKTLLCLIAGAALLAFSLAGAAPVDRPWTHYNDLLGLVQMDKFYAAPLAERDKVVLHGVVHPDDPAMPEQDVVFTIVAGAERQRIPVGADGAFDVPFKPEWVKSNPEVLTTVPAGQKAKFGFRAVPVLPKATQLDYADLMGGVPQVNALIKSRAGLLRFLMPTLVGITLKFPKESLATVTIQFPDGVKRISADAQGRVMLKLDMALLAANVPVTLSAMPVSTDFLAD